MTQDILVTGVNGQVGHAVTRITPPGGTRFVMAARSDLDLADPVGMRIYLSERKFAAIVNCAAYTSVDKAEAEIGLAWQVNALGPAILAEYAREHGIPIVHVSTDYVFSGDGKGGMSENDSTGPINVYGASKLGGELAISTSGAQHAILRTSWVVSHTGNNFVRTMLRLAAERDSLNVVNDQVASPTSAADLALAIQTVLGELLGRNPAAQGTFHFCNAGEISWAGFAKEIFAQSKDRGGQSASVQPIPTSAYPTPATRPLHTTLATEKFRSTFRFSARPWQVALSEILDELIGVPE